MKLYHGSNQWALLTLMMLEEKQKAYVKDSLTRAIREMKVAKIEGRKLQSVDGTLMWSHWRNNYKTYFL